MIFLDTNVLIDILAPGQAWREWSQGTIEDLGSRDILIVNQIVLAELASGFPALEEALAWLNTLGAEVRILDEVAAFAGGQAFRRYRQAGTGRSSVLADFLIGAHADLLGASLLTRDATVYRRYFPDLPLITPETEHG